ncbi:MAG: AbrB/MazE/SpoVT family DNA-binding domain-containing protein [Chloroflexota bacterium]
MKMTVPMNARGSLTIPMEVRTRLGIEGAGQFELELAEDAIVLRPTAAQPDDDAWAYTPDHRALLERAHRDSREGRVHHLSEADLGRIAEEADRTDAQGSVSGHVTPR